jgi:hypothetical protein
VLMVVGSTVVVGLVATAGLVLEGVGASLLQPPVLPWGLASSVSNLGTGPATAPTADALHSVTCVSICDLIADCTVSDGSEQRLSWLASSFAPNNHALHPMHCCCLGFAALTAYLWATTGCDMPGILQHCHAGLLG